MVMMSVEGSCEWCGMVVVVVPVGEGDNSCGKY
jgi:hypothetical protein